MKKGVFESKATLLLMEVLISLVVIMAFFYVAHGDQPLSYGEVEEALTATTFDTASKLVSSLTFVSPSPVQRDNS